jgi:prepilin-type N-terminal cleavage/methylation domain-containing protein
MPISSPGRASSRGVTLVEMVTVVAIIGIMAGLTFPAVSAGLASVRMVSASDSVAAFLNAALNRAERRQDVIELSISVKENVIRLASSEPGYERKLELPEGVRIAAVLPALDESVDPRTFMIQPGGTPPRVGVEIANDRGARRVVRVDPMTGVPRVERPEPK